MAGDKGELDVVGGSEEVVVQSVLGGSGKQN